MQYANISCTPGGNAVIALDSDGGTYAKEVVVTRRHINVHNIDEDGSRAPTFDGSIQLTTRQFSDLTTLLQAQSQEVYDFVLNGKQVK